MKRREFLGSLGTGAFVVSASRLRAKPTEKADRTAGASETAEEIYRRSYVTDAMCFSGAPPRSYVPYLTDSKVEALRTSGITALSMCMSSGVSRTVDNQYAALQENIEKWDAFVKKHSDVFMKVPDAALLDEAKRSGKVGFIYNLQRSSPIGWNLDRLKDLVEMGIRQIQLSYSQRNYSADGCWERTNAGLSRFGVEVVEALTQNRIILDLSHVGEQSAYEAIQFSKAPMIFSHSGCLSICPHPRNVSDRNIKAMADKGGVFCVYNQSGWLTKDPEISMDHYIQHVERVISLSGEDHVAMGTDGDAVDMTAMRPGEVARHQAGFDRRRKEYPQLDWDVKHMRVPELSHPKRLLHLAQALQKKGYKARTIEKIIGGNYVRIFKEVVG
jgi:membrane dipeptidase